MKLTNKLEEELKKTYEAENLKLRETVSRQAVELEEKERELNIESALEKVRARTMAMQKSDELSEVIQVTYEQLLQLNFDISNAGFLMDYRESNDGNIWMADALMEFPTRQHIPYFDHPFSRDYLEQRDNGPELFTRIYSFEEKNSWLEHIFKHMPSVPVESKELMFRAPGLAISRFLLKKIGLYLFNLNSTPYTDTENFILMRFAKVFEQTYTRFNDLKKAEAQAREAEIELGMERIRARSMAMQTSEELKDVVKELRKQIELLGQKELDTCVIQLYDESPDDIYSWVSMTPSVKDEEIREFYGRVPKKGLLIQEEALLAYASGRKDYTLVNKGKKLEQWIGFIEETYPEAYSVFVETLGSTPENVPTYWSFSDFNGGSLLMVTLAPPPDVSKALLRRFANVFGLAYRRFADLKQAEAQARESQIQLALERVRARTMAMQKSDELREVVATLYDQLGQLNFDSNACNIIIIDKETNNQQYWVSGFKQKLYPESYNVPYFEHPYIDVQLQSWRQGQKYIVIEYSGKTKKEFDKQFFSQTEFKNIPQEVQKIIKALESARVSTAYFTYGALQSIGPDSLNDENAEILQRFASVFDQTYTRFLDLQKAEAQAREAQIEAALEKIRSRSLAMHHSNEIGDVVAIVFEKLKELGLVFDAGAGIHLFTEGSRDAVMCVAAPELTGPIFSDQPYDEAAFVNNPIILDVWEAKITGTDFINRQYSFEQKNRYFEYMFRYNNDQQKLPQQVRDTILSAAGFTATFIPERNSLLGVSSWTGQMFSDSDIQVLKRVARVFEQAYIRFLDLQKAEAQAREAQIEAALERVRSRTMAMHRSEEIADIVGKIFGELSLLDLVLNRVLIWIFNDKERYISWWSANPEAESHAESYRIDYNDQPVFLSYLQAWQKRIPLHLYTLSGEMKKKWEDHLFTNTELAKLPLAVRNGMREEGTIFTTSTISDYGLMMVGSFEPLSNENIDIIQRFGRVFQQSYTRYLDVQKAEAQAREAKIEAALERVRSRSMGMQKSEELKEVIQIVYEQFVHLNIHIEHTGFILDYKERDDMHIWLADEHEVPSEVAIPYFDSPHWNSFIEAKKNGTNFFANYLSFDEKNKFYQDLFTLIPVPDKTREYYFNCPGLAISTVLLENVGLYIENFSGIPYSDEENKTLMRFGKVFEQTYTRFNDLQKAEAQAREAQIEASLEKVRAKVMAMQVSKDLNETSLVFGEQMRKLGIDWQFSYFWLIDEEKNNNTFWITWPDNKTSTTSYTLDEADESYQECIIAWRQQTKIHSTRVPEPDVPAWIGTFERITIDAGGMAPEIMTPVNFKDGVYYYDAMIKFGSFGILMNRPVTEEEKNIQVRFAVEFERAYTRFLDLQKAEAQAREAQIEAALEKIRSSSLAMHHSSEITNVVNVLYEKSKELELVFDGGIAFVLFTKNSRDAVIGVVSPELAPVFHDLPYDEDAFVDNPIALDTWRGKDEGIDVINKCYSFEQKNRYFQYVFKHNDESKHPKPVKEFILGTRSYTATNIAEKNSLLIVNSWTEQILSEENVAVLRRVARVFEQAYVRFLDLQKSEARAREAKIETALEKVRSRSLAMYKSDELKDVVTLVFEKLRELEVTMDSACILTFDEHAGGHTVWAANPDLFSVTSTHVPYFNDPIHQAIYNSRENGEDFIDQTWTFEEKNAMYKNLFEHTDWKFFPDDLKRMIFNFEGWGFTGPVTRNSATFLVSYSAKRYSEHEKEIIRRLGKVFDQAYIRFLDLQKAEAQAREAIKRASVDRVRAEIASMRTTSDLQRITPLIWNELTTLGVPFIRCGVFIMDEEQQQINTHLSTPGGESIAAFKLSYNVTGVTAEMLTHWYKKELYKQHWDETQFVQFTQSLVQLGAITGDEKYLTDDYPTDLYLHFLPFLQGMLYVGNTEPLSNDALQLVQNLADAFATAYARYEDFNKLESAKKQVDSTLNELQATQKQLIQSEKMASLGELTAGIAHEIQNPLNFVNNFSDVNKELVNELKSELATGNLQSAIEIADTIIGNEEKINHHGRRADAIVKGMLQHSRTSSGLKEPTDINALCDEYLRLSYHGLRAKDKSFNAKFETNFDNTIGKLNIIPHEIGRAILNLVNNAFYAVNEKQKYASASSAGQSYEPVVTVTTSKIPPSGGGGAEISIKDNGVGIPEKLLDKIFQPFFTTKPTGKGTGLGLSLAYDIIRQGHGGDLKVATKEGEGSEFIIQLPVNTN